MSDWWEEAPKADKPDDESTSESVDSGDLDNSTQDTWWDEAPSVDDEKLQDNNSEDNWWSEAPAADVPAADVPEAGFLAADIPAETAATESNDDIDPEMAEIFLEEAIDLQEVMDTAMQEWSNNFEDLSQIPVLHRTLHTIKGGARMAGVNTLGDLSHAMESFLGDLEQGRIKATEPALLLAQQTADRIGIQIDELKSGKAISADKSLLGQLENARANGEVVDVKSAAQPVQTPEAPKPQDSAPETSPGNSTGTAKSPGPESESQSKPEPEAVITEESLEDFEHDSRLLVESELMSSSELLGESQLLESSDFAESMDSSSQDKTGDSSEIIHFDKNPKKTEIKKADRSREQVRVNAELLDRLVNNAGEVSIYRSRLEQQNSRISFNLNELEQTVDRLQKQLRQLEIETEAQILFRHEKEGFDDLDYQKDFDPLELDRFSAIQELSRALSETVSDLTSINSATGDLARESETLLLQQSRVSTELQDGLLRTRMVPISQQMNRLQRVVRQTARTLGKKANLEIGGTVGEMDRNILESITGPLEHLLRNAVSHGVEGPEDRKAAGKPEEGRIVLSLDRDGTELVLAIADDGQGLNLDKIRKQATEKGLMVEGADVADDAVMQFILEPGFSTASEVTQISGRGVGMDVVTSEVKQLGGALEIDSMYGKGTTFNIRLPYTLAISDSMLVRIGEETYAIPHSSIEGVLRVTREEVDAAQSGENVEVEFADNSYQVRYLGTLLDVGQISAVDQRRTFPVLLVRAGESRMALQVDHLIGNRQIVVKSVGAQLSTVRWITGGTILGDGQVALIIDVNALVRTDKARLGQQALVTSEEIEEETGITVMVVDDSITVRKVTSRLLARHNMEVITAKDGVDALDVLQDRIPDVMLLDVEMPRMDGFELARHVKHTSSLKQIPIIMITSRTGEKHRQRALSIGVNSYLGKPYQEEELLDNIYSCLAEVEV